MGLSINIRQAYSEIDEFLGLLTIDQKNMIPKELREMFSKEKDKEYIKEIDPMIPIKEQNLKEETLGLIALLNLQYWCQDEIERERLKKIYAKNEKKYQEMLHEKFNPDNIFKKKDHIAEVEKGQAQCLQMIENKKEPLLKKILNRILQIFKIK